MLQVLAELCTFLVEDVYGELAAVCLVEHTPCASPR
jgi:hypothetical protein